MSGYQGEGGALSVVAGLGVLVAGVAAVAYFSFSDVYGRLDGVRANLHPAMSSADALAAASRMTGDFRLTTHEAVAGWRPGERVFVTIDGDGKGAYDVTFMDAPARDTEKLRCETPEALATFVSQSAPKIRRFDQLTLTAENLVLERAIRIHFDREGRLSRVEEAS